MDSVFTWSSEQVSLGSLVVTVRITANGDTRTLGMGCESPLVGFLWELSGLSQERWAEGVVGAGGIGENRQGMRTPLLDSPSGQFDINQRAR